MKFATVTGHEQLKAQLCRSVETGRVSHAQLFTGAPGHGTLPLALAYAAYLNCTGERSGDSCGTCPSCRKMAGLVHPDLHFVFPVAGGGATRPISDPYLPVWRELVERTGGYFDEADWYAALGVENQQGLISRAEADAVIRKLSFKSFEGRYKIVLVWLPERMRAEAANALLKVLEEPWERTVFLLVSAEPGRLLPTIRSRTQEVHVPAVGQPAVAERLREQGAAEEDAQRLARLAGGDLLEAERLFKMESSDAGQEFFSLFVELMRCSYNDRHLELFDWAERVTGLGRERQKRMLEYHIRLLRASYLLHAGLEELCGLGRTEYDFCKKFAPFVGSANVEPLLAEMELARQQVIQNGNARIIFSHFALTVSKLIPRKRDMR